MKWKLFFLLVFSAHYFVLAQSIEVKRLKKHVYYLADDAMKGRGTGSKENAAAADYIASVFKTLKLKPLGTEGYFQNFEAKLRKVAVPDSIRSARNVIGFLDNNATKTIVIGAHYDHLGEGRQGSSRAENSVGIIHNGADDNASGVAGLLELARIYTTNKIKEPVNFLFIAFGAEELGLVGSRYFVKNPTYDLSKVHWMLNMDMIGRFNPENGVSIIGYGTSPAFETIYHTLSTYKYIKHYTGYEGRGGSDQTSFYEKNIPVLFFHTGGHDDYHKPTDDAPKVDYDGLKRILELEQAFIEGSFKLSDLPFRNTDPKKDSEPSK